MRIHILSILILMDPWKHEEIYREYILKITNKPIPTMNRLSKIDLDWFVYGYSSSGGREFYLHLELFKMIFNLYNISFIDEDNNIDDFNYYETAVEIKVKRTHMHAYTILKYFSYNGIGEKFKLQKL